MHIKNIHTAGKKIEDAEKVLIMIHGRGADAQDILSMAQYLNIADYHLIAPQAVNHTWYPYSFLADPGDNEPWLSSALSLMKDIIDDLLAKGFGPEDIYFLGFSQGACLSLEFVARNARNYGGVAAFSGGLIGDKIYMENYKGDFKNTPIFIGVSDPDPHIPVMRVQESTKVLKGMNADLIEKIYEKMGHIISQDEINTVNTFIFKKS